MRIGTVFVAICMVIIAASAGAVAYLYLGLDRAAAIAVGFALLNHASAKKSFDDAVERAGAEDHRAAVDANVVMTSDGQFIEFQATAEHGAPVFVERPG